MTKSLTPSIFGDRNKVRPMFQNLHDELDRVFDEFRGVFPHFDADKEVAANGQLRPKIDVSETDKAVVVTADIPGVKEKDIDVTVANDVLVVKGEKSEEHEEKKKDYHLIERSHGSYQRSIPLGFEVKSKDVKANFENGVLTVTVKKPAEIAAKTQKIPITKAAKKA